MCFQVSKHTSQFLVVQTAKLLQNVPLLWILSLTVSNWLLSTWNQWFPTLFASDVLQKAAIRVTCQRSMMFMFHTKLLNDCDAFLKSQLDTQTVHGPMFSPKSISDCNHAIQYTQWQLPFHAYLSFHLTFRYFTLIPPVVWFITVNLDILVQWQ